MATRRWWKDHHAPTKERRRKLAQFEAIECDFGRCSFAYELVNSLLRSALGGSPGAGGGGWRRWPGKWTGLRSFAELLTWLPQEAIEGGTASSRSARRGSPMANVPALTQSLT